MTYSALEGRRIVVGVCGSIAAYKVCDVISRLRQAQAQIRVMATPHATEFVGLATLRALSGANVACEMFDRYPASDIEHISLGEFGEVLVIVAATANTIGKVAHGVCDDFLTTTLCAAAGKVIFAPAMNWRMWENPITQRNVRLLTELGYGFVGPDCGHLACGDAGSGRLCGTDDILDAIDQALGPPDSKLRGLDVLITSGPTREWLDPVRFICNPSSGKMGFALAREALARGAKVTVVSGPTALRAPYGANVLSVETTDEMAGAVGEHLSHSDVLIGAAAPVDFRPERRAVDKIKKTGDGLAVRLVPTPDILADAAGDKGTRIHVGFAAESQQVTQNAAKKLDAKGLDLIVANDITAPGSGFAADTNEVVILSRDGAPRHVGKCGKRQVAVAILDEVERLR